MNTLRKYMKLQFIHSNSQVTSKSSGASLYTLFLIFIAAAALNITVLVFSYRFLFSVYMFYSFVVSRYNTIVFHPV